MWEQPLPERARAGVRASWCMRVHCSECAWRMHACVLVGEMGLPVCMLRGGGWWWGLWEGVPGKAPVGWRERAGVGKAGMGVESVSTRVPGLAASPMGRGTASDGHTGPQAGSWHLRGRGAAGSPLPTS